jgi:site-specific recombinase XerD
MTKATRTYASQKLPKYLEKDEIYAILKLAMKANSNRRDYTLLRLMWSTGVRVSEAITITPADIEPTHFVINILHAKGGKQRRCHCDDKTLRALLAYTKKAKIDDDAPIFPISRIQVFNIVKGYGKQIERPDIHPHSFRHSFAVFCIREGMDIRTLQMLMGHESIQTTSIYLQFNDAFINKIYQKVAF